MLREDFSNIVMPLTKKEQKYRINPEDSQQVYQFMEAQRKGETQVYTFMWNDDMSVRSQYATITDRKEFTQLRHPHLFLSKQTRFVSVPPHHHNYLELNYVYSGSCRTVINGQEIILETGDICLMERDVVHSISALGESDILLNGMIKHSYFDMYLMNHLSNSGPVAHFLADVISHKKIHDKYIVFHTEGYPQIRETFENICCEFLEPGLCSVDAVDSYMILLFIQLARCYDSSKEQIYRKDERSYMTEVLRYIENHCESCTLTEVASLYGFHPNYLSRVVRQATGMSFKDHINQARLHRAEYWLRYSEDSTSEIAVKCGWSNLNQFYKKFYEVYGVSPGKYRFVQSKVKD